MLPELVLGLGVMLVHTLARLDGRVAIRVIAVSVERPRRRGFVILVSALLVVAVNLDFAGLVRAAGWCRGLAALASTQLAWKLWRLPGRRDRLSWAIWSSGWAVAAGFVAA